MFTDYHGINGNMSLDRRGEVGAPQNRYDLTLGSDKSSSLSRSEAGTYDVIQAEIQHAKRHELPTCVAMSNNNDGQHNGSSFDVENDAKKRVILLFSLIKNVLIKNSIQILIR